MMLDIPNGIEVTVAPGKITVKGQKGSVSREFPKTVEVKKDGNNIYISTKDKSAKGRTMVGTFISHIKNMLVGVQTPFIYKLKVVYTHFPITVSLQNNEIAIQNFLGEKRARKAKVPAGAVVKVQGEIVTVESPDIELAGMTATRIEQATRVTGKDRRTFLDGIYIIEKAGEPVTLE